MTHEVGGEEPESTADQNSQVLRSVYEHYARKPVSGGTARAGRSFRTARSVPKNSEREEEGNQDGLYRPRTGAKPTKWDPQPLGSVLGGLADNRGWQEKLEVAAVVARWPQIVGKNVAEHCVIESFVDDTLVARADSSAWAQQLRLLLPQIQARIDKEAGVGVVRQVIVKGPQPPSWSHGSRSVPGRGPRDTYG